MVEPFLRPCATFSSGRPPFTCQSVKEIDPELELFSMLTVTLPLAGRSRNWKSRLELLLLPLMGPGAEGGGGAGCDVGALLCLVSLAAQVVMILRTPP